MLYLAFKQAGDIEKKAILKYSSKETLVIRKPNVYYFIINFIINKKKTILFLFLTLEYYDTS